MLLRRENADFDDGFAHLLDIVYRRQLRGAVHEYGVAVLSHDFVGNRGRRGNQVQIVFPLEPLLDDFQVQHAEKAAAEAEAERGRVFRLILQ